MRPKPYRPPASARKMVRLSEAEITSRIQELHGNQVSILNGSETVKGRIDLQCNVCRHRWSPFVRSVIYSRTGCPACAGNVKITRAEFIRRSQQLHGDEFDYSLIEEFKYQESVPIRCRHCDLVWQIRPYSHLRSTSGCPDCRRKKSCSECRQSWTGPGRCRSCYRSARCLICHSLIRHKEDIALCGRHAKLTLEQFVRLAIRLHHSQYIYSTLTQLEDPIAVQCSRCKHHIRTTVAQHLDVDFKCDFCSG